MSHLKNAHPIDTELGMICIRELLKPLGPIRWLSCTCCGESARGRQWFNLDIGFGCCKRCADRYHTGPDRCFSDIIGVRGIHFDIQEPTS